MDFEDFGLTWSSVQSPSPSPRPPFSSPAPETAPAVAGTTPFTWNAQAFASSYTLEVYKNNDAAFSPGNRVFAATVKTPAYAWNQPLPADSTPYIWRVRKTDADGNLGPWSAPARFTSLGSAPVLTAPASNELVPPTGALLQWSEVAGATKYDVEVRATGSAEQLGEHHDDGDGVGTPADGAGRHLAVARDRQGQQQQPPRHLGLAGLPGVGHADREPGHPDRRVRRGRLDAHQRRSDLGLRRA